MKHWFTIFFFSFFLHSLAHLYTIYRWIRLAHNICMYIYIYVEIVLGISKHFVYSMNFRSSFFSFLFLQFFAVVVGVVCRECTAHGEWSLQFNSMFSSNFLLNAHIFDTHSHAQATKNTHTHTHTNHTHTHTHDDKIKIYFIFRIFVFSKFFCFFLFFGANMIWFTNI